MRGGWRASFIQQSQVVPSSCHCFHYENYLIKHSYLILLHHWFYLVHDHKMLLLMLNSSHMPPSLPPPTPPTAPPQKEKQQQQKKYFNTSCFKLQYLGNTNLMWNKKPFFQLMMTTLLWSLSCWKLNYGSAVPRLPVIVTSKFSFSLPHTHTKQAHKTEEEKSIFIQRHLISPQVMWFSSYSLWKNSDLCQDLNDCLFSFHLFHY